MSAAAAPRRLPRTAIGIGYDSHRFDEGRRLVLGGVEVPSTTWGSRATPTPTCSPTP